MPSETPDCPPDCPTAVTVIDQIFAEAEELENQSAVLSYRASAIVNELVGENPRQKESEEQIGGRGRLSILANILDGISQNIKNATAALNRL